MTRALDASQRVELAQEFAGILARQASSQSIY